MFCSTHAEFFDDSCPACRHEYLEIKSAGEADSKQCAVRGITYWPWL